MGIGASAEDPEARREREAVGRVLDQVGSELAAEPVSLEVFATVLRAGFDSLSIGRTPTRLDQVTVAEVQRSRLGEVRRAIVGGLSESDFPRPATTTRLLTDRERQILARLGLGLGSSDAARLEEEIYFFYIALTRSSEQLVLTRPASDLEGRALAPSPFLGEVLDRWPGLTETRAAENLDPADLTAVQTPEELAAHIGAYIASRLDRRRAGRMAPDPGPAAAASDARILAVYNRLVTPAGGPQERAVLEDMESRGLASAHVALARSSRLWGYDNHPVLSASVLAVAAGAGIDAGAGIGMGSAIDAPAGAGAGGRRAFTTSAGKLETFARCPYQHFARHGLRLEPRPRPQVTPLDNGLLVHRALEMVLREGRPAPDRAEIRARLEGVFQKLEAEELQRAYQADPSGRFRWKTVRNQLGRFIEIEAARLARSAFAPYRLEEAFGDRDDNALTLELPGGGRALVRGRIDRLDIDDPEHPSEAIVIDYKTKHRPGRGRLIDLQFGTDLQLAVYLLAVSDVLGFTPIAGLYAEVLPRPADSAPKDPENPLAIKLHGLVPKDQKQRVSGGLGVLSDPREKPADVRELRGALEAARATISLYASAIQRGVIDVAPIRRLGWTACQACDLASVCRVEDAYNPPRLSTREGLAPEE
jgi:ATP-dependent helicase/nuclease subunit B